MALKEPTKYEPPIKELLGLKNLKVNLEQIFLDPNNPRLNVARITPDNRVIEELVQKNTQEKLEDNGIDDLLSSVKTYGFVPTDPIVVREISAGKFVVVEGNRRAATLKNLLASYQGGELDLDPRIIGSIKSFQVLVYEGKDPDISWVLQGIRHMAGIKRWPALQQGAFIAKIEEQMQRHERRRGRPPGIPSVAKAAGVSTGTANLLLRSFFAFQQSKKDEEYGDKLLDDKFSMFQEAVFKSEDLQQWLEWDDRSREFKSSENLKKFLSWVIPPEGGGDPKIVRAIDARDVLPGILENAEMRRQFERGSLDIDAARVQLGSSSAHEPDLEFIKLRLSNLRDVLDALPGPKIQREGKREEFIDVLRQLREIIEFQLKTLGQ